MPIVPPKLDDRRFNDIVREARALIPQYCPEWTHLGDSDPGMTIVQLFAWMTEMTLFRINRVPDKTYVHFLNFIGEERRAAQPSTVPLSFTLRKDDATSAEIPRQTRTATRQQSGRDALHFVTNEPLLVHGAAIDRMVSVEVGETARVRNLPFVPIEGFETGRQSEDTTGIPLFAFDGDLDGPHSYTRDHYIYVRHPDFGLLTQAEGPGGTLRIRSAGEIGLPIAALFDWEYAVGDEEPVYTPMVIDRTVEGTLEGLPEVQLQASLTGWKQNGVLGHEDDPMEAPEGFASDVPVLRGVVQFERWLAARMQEELVVTWRDDWGAEPREVSTWTVRASGRTLEWFIRDLPPVRSGWTVRLTMVDHGLVAGRDGLFPRYRWSYRRRDRWVTIPAERVELQGSAWVITGPLTDMVADGFNLRAERLEVVHIESLLPGLEIDVAWQRPIVVHSAFGPETRAAVGIEAEEYPKTPFQAIQNLPPTLGMKFFVGSDLFLHRARKPIRITMDVSFTREGVEIVEPLEDYHLQMTYRTPQGWQAVMHEEHGFEQFRFGDLQPETLEKEGRKSLTFVLDPAEHLRGMSRVEVAGVDSAWLRIEITRAALFFQKDEKALPVPTSINVHRVDVRLEEDAFASFWTETLPGARVAAVEHRPAHRCFSSLTVRRDGEIQRSQPFDDILELEGEPHRALYFHFDGVLPAGGRLATYLMARGEAALPGDVEVAWEARSHAEDGVGWQRVATGRPGDEESAHCLDRSGAVVFELPENLGDENGCWVRAVLYRNQQHASESAIRLPPLPPVTHVLPNTVHGINVHAVRMEKFSGFGVPHQQIQLRRFPIHLPAESDVVSGVDVLGGLSVRVQEEDGVLRPWRPAIGNSFSTASSDDRVFVVDPVEGVLRFGNGLRGRLLPVGSYNVVVDRYHTVPGDAGNVEPGAVEVVEGHADQVEVRNVVAARGGRDAESIDEILQRAPSILTSRDRAVTRKDFEVIATEASTQVSRASCLNTTRLDGGVDVLVLPVRPAPDVLPDPFLSASLIQLVQQHLGERCLVNTRPEVRLATFQHLDVSVRLRRRVNTNPVAVREAAEAWIRNFLDPYEGGIDGEGWPFGNTLFSQDLGRMVREIDNVRHVVDVSLFPVSEERLDGPPGWETQQGHASLALEGHDLFAVRHVRVAWRDGAS
ncbi:MAG: baseplate J/gp47 family protein [Myxococcota bacterium]